VSKAGDIYENPVTGERVVIRVGKEESGGELVITGLYVSPGGVVAASTSTRTSRRPSRWSEGAWVSGSTGARRTRDSENVWMSPLAWRTTGGTPGTTRRTSSWSCVRTRRGWSGSR
jgi:hypothetical protein